LLSLDVGQGYAFAREASPAGPIGLLGASLHFPAGPLARFAVCIALALLALPAGACGRKGPPLPPQLVIPNSPEPVLVEESAKGVRVTWRRPREYVDGSPLDDLDVFEIQRACEPDTDFQTIGTVPIIDRERFRKERSFAAVDIDVPRDRPCRYRVFAVTADGYRSAPAESGSILPGNAPAPGR
jgi:predicted small lipoprotein YifL